MTWVLALRHWKLALAGVLLLALGVQTFRIARLTDKLEARTAERDLAVEQRAALIAEAERRTAEGKRAIKADKPKAEQRAKARTIIQYRDSECETPPDIQEALDAGWQR